MKWLLAATAMVPEIHMNGNHGFTLWFKATISRQSTNYQEKKKVQMEHHTHTHIHTEKEKEERNLRIILDTQVEK